MRSINQRYLMAHAHLCYVLHFICQCHNSNSSGKRGPKMVASWSRMRDCDGFRFDTRVWGTLEL